MIKWLICLLLGHDIDKEYSKTTRYWADHVGGIEVRNKTKFWCKRCKKYRNVG